MADLEIGDRYKATSDFTGEEFEVKAVSDGEGGVSLIDVEHGEVVTDIVSNVRKLD